MQRDVRTDYGGHPPGELRRCVRRRLVRSLSRWACLCPVRDGSGSDGRTRQPNTHNTEWRNLCYPWHPWFGRTVAVYEVFIKRGQSLSLCGFEEERHGRSVEIPTWMLEPATCCRLRMMAVPTVSCDALLELKALLQAALRPTIDVVLQAQHRPVLAAGGADATVSQSTATLATDAVPSAPPASVASGVPARHPREDHQIGSSAAPCSRQPRGRRRQRGRGGA